MARAARVQSIDVLRDFKVAMLKFAHAAHVAVDEAESEVQRTLNWLETEQQTFWAGEIRRRSQIVQRCMEAVRMKKVFKNAVGGRDSVVEEEKALAIAQRKLQEAEQKLQITKQWARKLAKEILMYKGHMQRFSTAISADIPVAAGHLDRMLAALQAYIALTVPAGTPEPAAAAAATGYSFSQVLKDIAMREAEEMQRAKDESEAKTEEPAAAESASPDQPAGETASATPQPAPEPPAQKQE